MLTTITNSTRWANGKECVAFGEAFGKARGGFFRGEERAPRSCAISSAMARHEGWYQARSMTAVM